jgi:hypothetical protein
LDKKILGYRERDGELIIVIAQESGIGHNHQSPRQKLCQVEKKLIWSYSGK